MNQRGFADWVYLGLFVIFLTVMVVLLTAMMDDFSHQEPCLYAGQNVTEVCG